MYASYRERRAEKKKFKLTYFNVRGRCEAIRLLLAAGKQEYEDNRLNGHTEWTCLKPKTPFGTLPLLEADGHMVNQSLAIGRLIAKMCDLGGSNYVHQARVDAIVDVSVDVREALIQATFKAMNNQKDAQEKIVADATAIVTPMLKNLQKQLGDNDFFVENKLTYADIQFYASMEIAIVTLEQENCLKSFPELQALYERVASVPEIQEYLMTRPVTQF